MNEPVEAKFSFAGEILLVETGVAWCGDLIQSAEQLDAWEPATVVNSDAPPHYHASRNNDAVTIDGRADAAWLPFEQRLHSLLGQCAGLYKGLNRYVDISGHTGFQLLRYKPGQHFHEHVDNVARHATWGQRQLSVVLYLNDGFDGGETYFPRQQRVITPVAGNLIVFPSHFTHPHASADVVTGVKFSVVTWFR